MTGVTVVVVPDEVEVIVVSYDVVLSYEVVVYERAGETSRTVGVLTNSTVGAGGGAGGAATTTALASCWRWGATSMISARRSSMISPALERAARISSSPEWVSSRLFWFCKGITHSS